MTFRDRIRRITFPLPQDQAKQGFRPNLYIRTLRWMAVALVSTLRLNGRNRFSNEFIQALDPKISIPTGNGRVLFFRTGHGRLLWRATTFREEEPMLLKWIDGFTTADCFYDIGANVGSYSLYAAQRGVPTLAFEAEINNMQLLCDNVVLNRLSATCTPISVALGDVSGLDVFYLKSFSKGDALHSVGRQSYLLADTSSVITLSILVARLDDLVASFGLPRPTKLKIDVDGNELKVIKGALDVIATVDEIYVEIDHKQPEHVEALNLLSSRGFVVREKESIGRQWNTDLANYLLKRRTDA